MCDFNGADFLSSGEKQYGHSVDELARELPKMLEACRNAVETEPKSARLHARYARVLAVGGEAEAAVKEARLGTELGSPMAMVLLGVLVADGNGVARDYGAAFKLFRDAAKKDHPFASFNLGVMLANGWGTARDDADAIAQFHRAAGGYDPLAMQILGDAYAKGRGVTADPAEVERWWKKAGERPQALPEGHRNPMRLAQLGRVEPDTGALVAWYERQARAGELWAQNYVGHLYEAGQWVPQDYATAQTWYRRASEAGFGPAQMSMAMLYSNGLGVERDPKESRRWMMMGMDQACDRAVRAEPGANACDRFGADAYDPGKVVQGISAYCMSRYADQAIPACQKAVAEFPSAVRYRAQLARALAHAGKFDIARREAGIAQAKGSTLAMTLLGAMSEYGYGAPKNEVEALAWYRKAADGGNGKAQNNLGFMYDRGLGVQRDYKKALDWYLLAQSRGVPQAKANLEDFFEEGRGAPTEPASAAAWYRTGAEAGVASAQYRLGSFYAKGRGVARDEVEAAKWLSAAAEQGYAKAVPELADVYLVLAQRYEKGEGVAQNQQAALQFYAQAAALGNKAAVGHLAEIREKAGDRDGAAKLREFFARAPEVRASEKLPVGFNLDPGKDEQREMQIRVAGTAQAASASMAADAFQVIFWIPPQKSRGSQQ